MHRLLLKTSLIAAIALVAAACGDDDAPTAPPAPATPPAATQAPSPVRTDAPQPTPTPAPPPETTPAPLPEEVVVLTHDSFFVPDDVLLEFEMQTGVEVRVLSAGDAGSVVNQAILTKDDPLADVLFGIDNTFLSRALDAGIFIPYESPRLEVVAPALQLDPEHRVTPIDFGDVCLNYDKAAFGPDLPLPETLQDLTDPAYRGLLVVEDPATSSPGLAFLLATVAAFPEESEYTWKDFWADLRSNDVLVEPGWEAAYYGSFSGGAGAGDRPLVVSYASSPPAEVIFADPRTDTAPTGVITDGCFRQIEFAGILAGTEAESVARDLIDFMLSTAFQNEIPLNMFVFPASERATLPPEFVEHTVIPDSPRSVDPAVIAARRNEWIQGWTEIMR